MNATAPAPTYRPPRRADYEPNVRAFLPGCEGEELKLRAGLLLMRDRAMATKPIAGEPAWNLLNLVESVASVEAFRPMPLDQLREIRRILVMCAASASDFDAVYAPKLPMEGACTRG
jgi:hypothetical protein